MSEYFTKLRAIHPKALIKIFESKSHMPMLKVWEFVEEFKPIDLYCYLFAKYGQPNGIMNFLRNDDSGNLIHWEWSLVNDDGLLLVQGHNFRTEVQIFRNLGIGLEREDFVRGIKGDFANYGKSMKSVREKLEKWTHFVNPYRRIESVLEQQIKTLRDLDIDPERDRKPQPAAADEINSFNQAWKLLAEKYNQALGLAFGIRAMLPVLAESFVNFIIFALAKPEIKINKRLFDETVRRPIDIRIQTLHLNCVGFTAPVNYESTACKELHSLMNERNDMLHGNVDIDRLSFEQIYFNGKVPIFTAYGSFWDKSIGLEAKTVRLKEIEKDYRSVENFRDYILSLLGGGANKSISLMLRSPQLEFDPKRGILGVLLPTHMIDGRQGDA